jgi:hypothetical protein
MPGGDFSKIASGGWAISLDGYQFMDPLRKVAVGRSDRRPHVSKARRLLSAGPA